MSYFSTRNMRIQVRTGTTAQWNTDSVKLACGEMGYDSDTNILKIGDGIHVWEGLPAITGGGGGGGSTGPTGPAGPTGATGPQGSGLSVKLYVSIPFSSGDYETEVQDINDAINDEILANYQGYTAVIGDYVHVLFEGDTITVLYGCSSISPNVVWTWIGPITATSIKGETGPQGSTGPAGPTTSIQFDGGYPSSVYSQGPVFDCGRVV